MKQELDVLEELAHLALTKPVSGQAIQEAARIVRRATGATRAAIVYVADQQFLMRDDGEEGTEFELSQGGLAVLQRCVVQTDGPLGFRLEGRRIEEFAPAETEPREFLAFAIPFSGAFAEMCILRGPWDKKDWETMLRFAGRALPSLAVLVGRFLDAGRVERQRNQLAALGNAGQVLINSQDLRDALRNLTAALAETTGYDFVSIDVYDAGAGRFLLRAMNEARMSGHALNEFWLAAFNPDRPDPIYVQIVETRQPVLMPDVQKDERVPQPMRDFYRQTLLRSVARFPLLFQDEVLGVLSAASFRPRTFPEGEVSLLGRLASEVATALKAARAHRQLVDAQEALRKARDELEGRVRERTA